MTPGVASGAAAPVPFSDRTAWQASEGRLAAEMDRARAEGRVRFDLAESNPARCGLAGGPELVAELGHPRGAGYEPDPRGHIEARRAVAAYHAERGVRVDPAHVVLTASTSEAYAWLFKLLCNGGDVALVPEPSYPLFELLARLEDVRLSPYPLLVEEGFRVDREALSAAAAEGARAVLVVHPNNPTGSLLRRDDASAIEALAAERGMALIVDEVFGDYAWPGLPADRLPTFAGRDTALTFVLSGLSKVLAMPQLKLGWMVVSGPAAQRDAALARLEVIADTYLSVGGPVQRALPALLAARAPVQARILERVRANAAVLDTALAGGGVGARRLAIDAGWYAVVEVPRTESEDAWVLALLEDEVLVHPGWFFDWPRAGYLVVSLLPGLAAFAEGARRLAARLGR
ncbi:MAG: pyridoxal phosphate-dependent aminotransferase [Polyangiaceae bacterium]